MLVEFDDVALVPLASDPLLIVGMLSWLDFNRVRHRLVHDAPAAVEYFFGELWGF